MLASLSSPVLAVLGLCSGIVYIFGKFAYNLWLHPLSHIPGPWYAAISPLYMIIQDVKKRRVLAAHALLQEYGGTVRITPDQIAFVDQAASRIVYTKFPKSPIYKALIANDNDSAFTTLENRAHSVRRRAYVPHYLTDNIALYQPEIHEFINVLMDKMRQYGGKKPFDCLLLFHRMLLDVIFVSSYGQRIDSLKRWDIVNFTRDPASDVVDAIDLILPRCVLRRVLPTPLWTLLNRYPPASFKPTLDSDRIIAGYVIRAKDQVLANDPAFKATGDVNPDASGGDERLSLVHRLLRQSIKAKAEDKLTQGDIISEGMSHTIAGVETSTVSLSYMLYNLALYPDILAKLREEVDPLMTDSSEDGIHRTIPDTSVLSKLPYLNAIFKESLRMYGPVAGPLTRVVPPALDGDFYINGYKIPPGSIVGTQSWTVHRDPTVFPEPNTFKPERWLNETDDMRSHWHPFGLGSRSCAGVTLANITIRASLAAIVRNFDIVIPEETTPESMKPAFVFSLTPAGGKVPLIFKPRVD